MGAPRQNIRTFRDLRVYQYALDLAMEIFHLSKTFPVDERYSLVDQMRRSSRSVCSNLAEAWRKRRYRAAFVSKMSDSESEAAETRVWLEFALHCGYIEKGTFTDLDTRLERVLSQLVRMIIDADNWLIRSPG
jgi:four helix bundle protein